MVADDENMIVTLTAAGGLNQPVTSDMLGALARVVTPSQSPYVYFGRVVNVDPGADEFTIEDPTGALYTAMDTYDGILTVFDHHDADINSGQVHTAGIWTANPSYGSSVTTFTNANNDFPTYAQGWTLQPDARYPVFYPIVSAAAGSITVAGDVTGTLPDVTENDVYYFIIPPAGVDKTNGALSLAPTEPVSRYLAFQYFYLPPVLGVYVDDERVAEADIYGRQAGDNLASQYYCWQRFYQPDTGRWTTPDPIRAGANLFVYCAGAPSRHSDPNGMLDSTQRPPESEVSSSQAAWVEWIAAVLNDPIQAGLLSRELPPNFCEIVMQLMRQIMDANSRNAWVVEAMDVLTLAWKKWCLKERKSPGVRPNSTSTVNVTGPRDSFGEVIHFPHVKEARTKSDLGHYISESASHEGLIQRLVITAHGTERKAPSCSAPNGVGGCQMIFEGTTVTMSELADMLRGRTLKRNCEIVLNVCYLGNPECAEQVQNLADRTQCVVKVPKGSSGPYNTPDDTWTTYNPGHPTAGK